MKELNIKLAKIQQELKAPKGQFNKFANFNYRSCEDILEAVKPLLGDLTLTISDEVVNIGDRYYVKATASLADGTATVEISAFAREADEKKGMDDAQITGATSSYARKYALNGLFAIDDTKDADTQDNTVTTKITPKSTKYKSPVTKPEVSFLDDKGEIARDTKGHTACVGCGQVVSERVEQYSTEQYGKILCMNCQIKEKTKNANK